MRNYVLLEKTVRVTIGVLGENWVFMKLSIKKGSGDTTQQSATKKEKLLIQRTIRASFYATLAVSGSVARYFGLEPSSVATDSSSACNRVTARLSSSVQSASSNAFANLPKVTGYALRLPFSRSLIVVLSTPLFSDNWRTVKPFSTRLFFKTFPVINFSLLCSAFVISKLFLSVFIRTHKITRKPLIGKEYIQMLANTYKPCYYYNRQMRTSTY